MRSSLGCAYIVQGGILFYSRSSEIEDLEK